MLSVPHMVYAQDLSNINITVVNEFDEPLAGLQLQVGKTEVIAVTNEQGVASFQSLQKGDIINILSSTGSRHSTSINSDQQKIVMHSNTSVVQKGFNLKETKFGTTASINSINSQNLNSSATNPANALYGALAGLTVMQDGTVAWSNNPSISIRGGLNSPLILVDGFERPLDVLTVEEIESISVLKDASALAIYGMRGANGVVLVTTKRGHFEGMKATASYQFGYNTPFRLPKMLNGFNYASAMNEALALDGLQARYSQYDLEDLRLGRNTELLPNVDWAKEALRDQGYTHQLTASFSGGSKRVRYYSMLSYIGDNGFLKPVDLSPDYNSQMEWDRLSLRANLDITLTQLAVDYFLANTTDMTITEYLESSGQFKITQTYLENKLPDYNYEGNLLIEILNIDKGKETFVCKFIIDHTLIRYGITTYYIWNAGINNYIKWLSDDEQKMENIHK